MESKRKDLVGLPDRFVAVEIETEATPAFDAAQYSFFGDLSAADTGLEGALEDGLEAPPPEDGLASPNYGLHVHEEEHLHLEEVDDLSVAALFRNQLGLGPSKAPPKQDPEADDDAGLNALLADPLSVARTQLRDEDYEHRGLPAELYLEGLSNSQTAASGEQQPQPQIVYASPQQSYGLFGSYTQSQPQAQAEARSVNTVEPPTATGAATMPSPQPPAPPPTTAGNALLQMLKKPSLPPKAMTLEEVEARMLGTAEASAAAPAATTAAAPGAAASAQPPAAPPVGPPLPPPPPGMPAPPLPQPGVPPAGLHPHEGMSPHGAGHMLPPEQALYPQMPPPGPHGPPPHGAMPPGPGMPPAPQPPYPHMHPHMHPHAMYGMPPPGPNMGPPYPPPGPPLGSQHAPGFAPHPPPHAVYGNAGVLPPLAHHLQHPQFPHHLQHPQGMMPPGAMGPGPFGPGPMPPRPMHHGPMGPMGGHAPYPHDPSYQMRPGPPGPGMPPGPMHGAMQQRPPAGQPHGLGPMGGPSHAPPPPGVPHHRPPGGQMPPHAPPPPPPLQHQQQPGAPVGAQRPTLGVLGAGAAAAPRPVQARQSNGLAPPAPDFGQQFARGGFGPGPGQQTAVALAAAAAAAGRAGGAPSGPGGRLRGRYMTPENIEYVVRSLLHNVATGVPYVEDYYYQAFVHKHVSAPSRQQLSPGAFPMAALFVPQALRTLTADQMRVMRLDPSAQVKFVEGVQGLGKIVLSNIRTPKVLMDLSDRGAQNGAVKLLPGPEGSAASSSAAAAKAADEAARSTRPLEQEPLLAARIMIEDCMNLLLDLDDIDRLAYHMAAVQQAQQRAAAVAAALPLPGPAAAAAAAAAVSTANAAAPAMGPYGPDSEAPPSPVELRQRRDLLLAGINGAFRLPNAPQGAAPRSAAAAATDADAGGEEEEDDEEGRGAGVLGDGVLLRILALSKGRNMVARALLAVAPPAGFAALAAKAAPARGPSPQPAAQQQQQQIASQAASGKPQEAASASDGQDANAAPADAAASSPPASDQAHTDAAAEDGDAAARGSAAPPAPAQPSSAAASTLLGPDGPSPYVLLWGTLRNAWMLFGSSTQQGLDPATERPMLEATARLAAALRDALLRLPSPRDVVDAAVAFNAGCQQHVEAAEQANPAAAGSTELTLLPLAQTRAVETTAVGSAPAAWLGEALAALVMRAGQLGLVVSTAGDGEETQPAEGAGGGAAPGGGAGQPAARDAVEAAWGREFGLLHDRLSRHLAELRRIHSYAVGNAEALAVVRAMCCRQLVNAMLPHASPEQAQQLREALAAFAA